MAQKNNIRSIRFSDAMAELIDRQAGRRFTEKFENLITRCVWELPAKEAAGGADPAAACAASGVVPAAGRSKQDNRECGPGGAVFMTHFETERPCVHYGKRCYTCRLRQWCMLFREKPPKEKQTT